MRPRTFAREIAFQVLYREDLNPPAPPVAAAGPAADPLLAQGRRTRDLEEFVRHMAALRDQEDGGAGDEGELYSQWLRTPALVEFSRLLIEGVEGRRGELDEKIAAAAANWSVGRMAATDRNLLRLGCYEICHTETPPKVVIDEAVELAKRFGGGRSAQFVNGILDKLMQRKEEVRSQESEVRMETKEANEEKQGP